MYLLYVWSISPIFCGSRHSKPSRWYFWFILSYSNFPKFWKYNVTPGEQQKSQIHSNTTCIHLISEHLWILHHRKLWHSGLETKGVQSGEEVQCLQTWAWGRQESNQNAPIHIESSSKNATSSRCLEHFVEGLVSSWRVANDGGTKTLLPKDLPQSPASELRCWKPHTALEVVQDKYRNKNNPGGDDVLLRSKPRLLWTSFLPPSFLQRFQRHLSPFSSSWSPASASKFHKF